MLTESTLRDLLVTPCDAQGHINHISQHFTTTTFYNRMHPLLPRVLQNRVPVPQHLVDAAAVPNYTTVDGAPVCAALPVQPSAPSQLMVRIKVDEEQEQEKSPQIHPSIPARVPARAPGFGHGSRATRATDSVNEERFPYEPSNEENSTFEYVLFPREGATASAALMKAVPGLFEIILVFVNVTAIANNIYGAPLWSGDTTMAGGIHDHRNDALLSIAALMERVCCLAAHWFQRLTFWCDSFVAGDAVSAALLIVGSD